MKYTKNKAGVMSQLPDAVTSLSACNQRHAMVHCKALAVNTPFVAQHSLCACAALRCAVLCCAVLCCAVRADVAHTLWPESRHMYPGSQCKAFCCHKLPAIFFCSKQEDTADEKEALLVLCANELAQLYTIIAADKVRQQPLLCGLTFAAAAAAAVHSYCCSVLMLNIAAISHAATHTFRYCSCSLVHMHLLYLF